MRQDKGMRRWLGLLIGVLLCLPLACTSASQPLRPPYTTIDIDRAIRAVSIDESGYAYECFADTRTSPLPYGCNLDPAATYEYFQGAWRKR